MEVKLGILIDNIKNMKFITLLLFPVLISCTLFYSNKDKMQDMTVKNENYQNTEDSLIQWSVNYKLQWSDFVGKIDSLGEDRERSAVTWTLKKSTEWKLSKDSIEFNLICYFLRYNSWKKIETDELLKHEQGHFNLSEIHMRKLRKTFCEYESHDLQATVDFYYLEYSKMEENNRQSQDLYDKETNFSKNEVEQKKWSTKIENMLKETSNWADTKVIIKRY